MNAEHVQTKREIAAMLSTAGMRPRKRFGQHFLIDGNLMRRLLDAAELGSGDCAFEVGGGTGSLTELLTLRAGRVVCVEVDRVLFSILHDRLGDRPGVTLILGDVLAGKHRIAESVATAILPSSNGPTETLKLVANLPYQIATPLVMNLLLNHSQLRAAVFTVQREVGERFTAQPNEKSYGPLSILTQLLCHVSIIGSVPPEAFWPRPAVSSSMIRADVVHAPFCDRDALHRFAQLVRGTFEHRRKTLRSALGYVIDPAAREKVCDAVDASRRPESFSTDEWLAIFQLIDAEAVAEKHRGA